MAQIVNFPPRPPSPKSGPWRNSSVSNQNRPSKRAETYDFGPWLSHAERESGFVPGLRYEYVDGMHCPGCGYKGPEPEHWERFDCPECDLRMYLAGRSLRIWR